MKIQDCFTLKWLSKPKMLQNASYFVKNVMLSNYFWSLHLKMRNKYWVSFRKYDAEWLFYMFLCVNNSICMFMSMNIYRYESIQHMLIVERSAARERTAADIRQQEQSQRWRIAQTKLLREEVKLIIKPKRRVYPRLLLWQQGEPMGFCLGSRSPR